MGTERRNPIGRVLFYLLVAVIFIYLMFPFYWALISALKPHSELIRTPATFWPEQLTFENFG
ncbi:MAG TPA: carbohydrate ABC transporter permease, partial [Deinococcales bacterium]|nr:carbohydrate ABC transporter permease [Deinococcales bacterium]